jgi:hypothetical protein
MDYRPMLQQHAASGDLTIAFKGATRRFTCTGASWTFRGG